MRTYQSRFCDRLFAIRQIFRILHWLNLQDELGRLVHWADEKRLPGPHKAYLIKLDDVEHKLFRYAVSSPRLVTFARILHGFKVLATPMPRYLPRGSASIYRSAKA